MMGKKVMIQFLASAMSGGLALLILALSARLFGPEILGQVAYFIGILGLIFTFSDLGLSRSHVHFTAARGGQPELTTFLAIKLPLLLVAGLAATAWSIWQRLPGEFLVLLLVEIFYRLADSILISFEGQERAWPQNLLKLAVKIIRLLAVIIFGWKMASVIGYALSFLIEAAVIFLGALIMSRRWWSVLPTREALKRYLIYSWPFAAIIPLSYLQENSLVLMLKYWQGNAALGIYVAGFGLFGFIKSFSSSLMTYFFPRISQLNQVKDQASIQRYTDMAVKFSIWIMAPLVLILLIFSQWLVPLVLGNQFIPAINVFRIYLLGILLLAIFNPYDHVLFATNNHRSIVRINFLTTLLLLILGWQLVPVWGGAGAAWTNVIIWLIGGFWQFRVMNQKTGIRFLRDWRLSKVEVKYLYGLIHSFGQAVFRFSGKKTG